MIYTNENYIIVENPIQPRSDKTQSSQTGLKNIQSRYAFFTAQKIQIINDRKTFKVILPLILKMKVVIVEDEKLSAEHLALLLQRIDSSIEVVRYLDTVKGTVKAFQDGIEADLLFLDIHLADGNSFEIFNQIQIDTPIIFTTAYDQYAIQAFKQNSIDYLLKPVSLKDLQFAFEKYKKQQQTNQKQWI